MSSGVKVTGYKLVNGGDVGLTQAIGTIGPISAYIYAGATKFELYSSGVYSDLTCNSFNINHAILFVGNGSLNENNYYI